MMTISGPYCLVCGGHNVVRQRVWDVSAWTEQGPRYGWVDRDICLDCQREAAGSAQAIPYETSEYTAPRRIDKGSAFLNQLALRRAEQEARDE